MSAPSNLQIEKLLQEYLDYVQKMKDAKIILSNFKIKSEHLTELKNAAKQLREQVNAEKERIEEAFHEDPDYVQALEDEIENKEKAREKGAQLKEMIAQLNQNDPIAQYEFKFEEEPTKVQMERVVKLYINGKEQK